jgi:hypothetical protein
MGEWSSKSSSRRGRGRGQIDDATTYLDPFGAVWSVLIAMHLADSFFPWFWCFLLIELSHLFKLLAAHSLPRARSLLLSHSFLLFCCHHHLFFFLAAGSVAVFVSTWTFSLLVSFHYLLTAATQYFYSIWKVTNTHAHGCPHVCLFAQLVGKLRMDIGL